MNFLLPLGIALLAGLSISTLAPKAFLVARRGGNPSPIPAQTLAGLALLSLLVVGRFAAEPVFGGPLLITRGVLGYAAGWLCAAMLVSALPYWLVVLFKPEWPVLDRLEAALTSAEEP